MLTVICLLRLMSVVCDLLRLSEINACTAFPCVGGAQCTDKPGAGNDTNGRTCSCGTGYTYDANLGCDGELTSAVWLRNAAATQTHRLSCCVACC